MPEPQAANSDWYLETRTKLVGAWMHCLSGLGCLQLNLVQLTTSDISVLPVAHLDFSASLRGLRESEAGSINGHDCILDLQL